MPKAKILQIVPELPPEIGGVGDYALIIARGLDSVYKIKSDFLVGNLNWEGPNKLDNFSILKIDSKGKDLLASKLSNYSTVILHYVCYGYDKRGCPNWLVNSIVQWKKQNSDSKLITMFHEIYSSSKFPWRSSFWLSKLQKYIATRLLNSTDICITSNCYYQKILKGFNNKKDTLNLPVVSNIGEPKNPCKLSFRSKNIVVFGKPQLRSKVYMNYSENIKKICELFGIKTIYDVGPKTNIKFDSLFNIPFIEKGAMNSKEVSNLFLNCYFGIVQYNDIRLLAKSGVFASYCSHRMVPFVINSNNVISDNLIPMQNYLPFNDLLELESNVNYQFIADSAFNWYKSHCKDIHIKKYYSLLMG